jgi:hypothetical protein
MILRGRIIIGGPFEPEMKQFFQPLCPGGVRASGQSPDSDDFTFRKTLSMK